MKSRLSHIGWRTWAGAAAIVLAGLWIYAPALHGEWLWDDSTAITHNPLMRDPGALWKIWLAPSSLDFYPIATSVQWIQWHFWSPDPFVFHLTNVLLQIADALLFWAVLRRLGLRCAWLGGALFIVHPLTVESVAWIMELKNVLSLLFLLLAFLCYQRWEAGGRRLQGSILPPPASRLPPRPPLLYLGSLLFFAAAMLSKSSVAMFPFVLLLLAWWRRGRIGRRDVFAAAPFFVVSLVLGVVTIWLQAHRAIGSLPPPHVGGFFSRAAVAGLSAAFYLGKFLAPVSLMPIYPHWRVDPPSLLQFLPWALCGGFAWICWRRRWRGLLFGLGVYAVNLFPASGFLTAAYMRLTWVMDHLAYVSLLGLMGLVAAAAGELFSQEDRWWNAHSERVGRTVTRADSISALGVAAPATSHRSSRSSCSKCLVGRRLLLWLLPCAVLLTLAAESRSYARAFSSGRAFWGLAVRRNPQAAASHYNLAVALLEGGDIPEAIAHLEEAVRLKPDYAEAHANLATALSQTGRYAEAIGHYRQALAADPSNAAIHYNYGLALKALGRDAEAREQWEQASELLRRSEKNNLR